MNKFAIICLAGSTLALAACDTTGTGNVETAAPYSTERTASAQPQARVQQRQQPAEQERVFRRVQTK